MILETYGPCLRVSYLVHKYMATHISPKDVKENILSVTSAPSYIKDSQKLDEYNKK